MNAAVATWISLIRHWIRLGGILSCRTEHSLKLTAVLSLSVITDGNKIYNRDMRRAHDAKSTYRYCQNTISRSYQIYRHLLDITSNVQGSA